MATLKTRLFELRGNLPLEAMAGMLGLSPSEIYRVREGKRGISGRFVAHTLLAFPEYTFYDLFYIDGRK